MEDHHVVDFFERHNCSGHSICANQKSYVDQNILSLTLIGAYALNRLLDANPNKLYPMFHCLGPQVMEQAHFLIKELYIVSAPQFYKDASFYPIL